MSQPTVEIRPDLESLSESLANWIVERYAESNGPFALNLSGGSTPKRLYEILGSDIVRTKIDWERVHIFIGDERFVPKDHPSSNFKMIHETLISRVPIPGENVYPIATEGCTPEESADAYEKTLQTFLGKETLDIWRPLFSVTLLGLGDDGHTASLFPGTSALRERVRWVTPVIGAKEEARISMTFPVLSSSRNVVFLVAGEGKRAMLKRLIERDPGIPATNVEAQGKLHVFCDELALGDPKLLAGA